jgi:hypothetical protein
MKCSICQKRVALVTAKTDEVGQAVHEECYLLKLGNKLEQGFVHKPEQMHTVDIPPSPDLGSIRELPIRITTSKESAEPRTPVMRCSYCIDDGNFKVMVQYRGAETWYMCPRCGHLALSSNPLFKCTCAKCVEVDNQDRKRAKN